MLALAPRTQRLASSEERAPHGGAPAPSLGGARLASGLAIAAPGGAALACGSLLALSEAGAAPAAGALVALSLWLALSVRRGLFTRAALGAALGAGYVLPFAGTLYETGRAVLGLEPLWAAAFLALLFAARALPWALLAALAVPLASRRARVLAGGAFAAAVAGLELLLAAVWGGLEIGGLATAYVSGGELPAPPWVLCGATALAAWTLGGLLRHEKTRRAGCVLLVAVAAGLTLSLRAVSNPAASPESESPNFRVLVISGDLPSGGPGALAAEHYLRLTEAALARAEEPVDLVVWPEGAVAGGLEEAPQLRARIGAVLRRGHAGGLLLGCDRRGPQGQRYNGALLLDAAGQVRGSYARRNLLAFGERTPSWGRAFTRRGTRDYDPGPRDQAPLRLGGVRLRVVLCAEGLDPDLSPRSDDADLIVVLANDGVLPGGERLKDLLARSTSLRSADAGAPLLRVANCGPSIFVSEGGALTELRREEGPRALLIGLRL